MQDAQQQLLTAQSESASIAKAKAMMEVETMRINQRIEILNNVGTQATLLASASIAFLGGEALETVDEFETIFHRFTRGCYVGAGAISLVASLWVIIISSHLIALTRDASLRKNIIKASRLLDTGLKDVRAMHYIAMTFLLLAVLSGALLNMSPFNSLIATVIFIAFAFQVQCKLQYTSLQFYEEVELDVYDVAATGSIMEVLWSWYTPMRVSNMRRVRRMWSTMHELHKDDHKEWGHYEDRESRTSGDYSGSTMLGHFNSSPNAKHVRLPD